MCAGVELGRLHAQGVGLTRAASFDDWWLASGAGLEMGDRLGSVWFWRAHADAWVPLLREEYFVNGADLVHSAAWVGFRGALGVGVAFQ